MINDKILNISRGKWDFPLDKGEIRVEGENSVLFFDCTELDYVKLLQRPRERFVDLLGIGNNYIIVRKKSKLKWNWGSIPTGYEGYVATVGTDKYMIQQGYDNLDECLLFLGDADCSDTIFLFARAENYKKLMNMAEELAEIRNKYR